MNNGTKGYDLPCLFLKCFIKIFHFSAQLGKINFLNVQTSPNSPTQNGPDSFLELFASLPNGGTIPKSILATIFVEKQNEILSLDSQLEDFTDSFTTDERMLTPEQQQNAVPISILNFPVARVSVASSNGSFFYNLAND